MTHENTQFVLDFIDEFIGNYYLQHEELPDDDEVILAIRAEYGVSQEDAESDLAAYDKSLE